MVARQGLLVGGTVLILFACGSLRAEESLGLPTNSAAVVKSTSSQPAVRGHRLFWLFGRPAYASSYTSVPAAATSVAAVSTAAPTTVIVAVPVTRTTRPQDNQQPALPPTTPAVQPQPSAPATSTQLSASIFGSGTVPTSQLSQERGARASGRSSDVVSGSESRVRATTDAGNLLGKSSQARGVSTQQRTPIMTDTRIRGSGVGRMVASGG